MHPTKAPLIGRVQELEQQFFDQMAASKQDQLRLAAEHAVSRILSVSSTLGEAAPRILQSMARPIINVPLGLTEIESEPITFAHERRIASYGNSS